MQYNLISFIIFVLCILICIFVYFFSSKGEKISTENMGRAEYIPIYPNEYDYLVVKEKGVKKRCYIIPERALEIEELIIKIKEEFTLDEVEVVYLRRYIVTREKGVDLSLEYYNS